MQPCEPLKPTDDSTEMLPLIVKSMRVTTRPQREEPCIIKEGDMEIIRDDLKGFKIPPRTPCRVILNNQTLSIFQTDNFEDIMFSVTLKEMSLQKQPNDVNCLRVTNERSKESKGICALAIAKESQKDNIKSWIKNIDMFKNACQEGLKSAPLFPPKGTIPNQEPSSNPAIAAK